MRTAYGREVRVTSSHSVFVHEKDGIKLKRGADLNLSDRMVAPARIRFPADAPSKIDLLRALHAVPDAAKQIWLRGPAVEAWFKAGVLERLAGQDQLTAPRVDIPAEVRAELAQRRRASGVSKPRPLPVRRHSPTHHVLRVGKRPVSSDIGSFSGVCQCDRRGCPRDLEARERRTKSPRTGLGGAIHRLRTQYRAGLCSTVRARGKGSGVVRQPRRPATHTGALRPKRHSAIHSRERRPHGIARLLSGGRVVLGPWRHPTLHRGRATSVLSAK